MLAEHDLLVTPCLTRPAIAADHFAFDPVEIEGVPYGNPRFDWYPYTHPFNHTGHPALALPAGWTAANMPVGLQIVAPLARRGPPDPRRRRARSGAPVGGPASPLTLTLSPRGRGDSLGDSLLPYLLPSRLRGGARGRAAGLRDRFRCVLSPGVARSLLLT